MMDDIGRIFIYGHPTFKCILVTTFKKSTWSLIDPVVHEVTYRMVVNSEPQF